ncbi:MAG: phytanoyl-CoA dioxygenase family protein [Planctomycetes bacterium]|nr:phytanoyl-CoA dioxygenase family protein [Planctomycetota bacterium]
MSTPAATPATRPFPALTPSQRYHLDAFGYVILPKFIDERRVAALREALLRLRRDLMATGDPINRPVRNARMVECQPHHVAMISVIEADPAISAYGTDPAIVAMAQEIVGSDVRITDMASHINSRDPAEDLNAPARYPSFHTGIDIAFGSHLKNGLYHCSFVKALTTLVDLGPDDGGTVVIPGSHKIDVPQEDVIAAAYADPSLIHQMIAPAGSLLLFFETVIHTAGQVRSGIERMNVIAGYGPVQYPYWGGADQPTNPTEDFMRSQPAEVQTLLRGRQHWNRGKRYRALQDPIDPRVSRP